MKNFKTTLTSLVFAALFATVISCSEQDEIANPIQTNGNGTQGTAVKTRSSGRVGGELFHTEVGDPLDLTIAKSWTANYRAKNPDEIRAHFFGTEIIEQILAEAGCVGIRMYYALDENGEKKLLLVGVDADGNDLLPLNTNGGRSASEGDIVGDYSFPCPTYCGGDGL